jgi:RsiW-degrading membrane proteinase PrsW (M82 family)
MSTDSRPRAGGGAEPPANQPPASAPPANGPPANGPPGQRVESGADGPEREPPTDAAEPGPVIPTPVWTLARRSLRLPAFWLLVVLIAIGGWRIGDLLRREATGYPLATAVAFGLFTLYAAAFIAVVRSLDYFEREPPLLLLAALAWGALVATAAAVRGDAAMHDLLAKLISPAFAASWGPAVAGPTVEELAKTLGVVVIVLIAHAQINSVVDGFVYGAFVGLGFQVIEDIVYALNAVALAGRGDSPAPVIGTFLLRGFLGGLWSHTLFSALAGAGVAYAALRRDRRGWQRIAVALAALAGAWLFHFGWNSPLLADGFGYGAPGVLAALLLKGIPALLLIALLIRDAGRREAAYYLDKLVGDPRVATPSELVALKAARTRSAARRYAGKRLGRPGRRAVRRLQRAQAMLALEVSRGGVRAARYRAAALAERELLESWQHPDASAPDGTAAAGWTWLAGCVAAAGCAILLALAIRALGGG